MTTVLTVKLIGFVLGKRTMDLPTRICGKSGEKESHVAEQNISNTGDFVL